MMDEGFGGRKVLDKALGADFVEVMFAKSMDEARECCAMLEEAQIPARFDKEAASADKGIAVLVPEDRFVEASEVLTSRVQNDSVDEEDDETALADEDLDDVEAFEDDDEIDDDDDDDDDDEFDDDLDDDEDEEEDEEF